MSRARDTLRALREALPRPTDPTDPDNRDAALVERLAGPTARFCNTWYRLSVDGWEHAFDGPALVVGNHNSGTSFLEALGVGARWHQERPHDPWLGLAHDKIVEAPGLGGVLSRLGALRAGHESAARAFAGGYKVAVFPGGNREAFRPWRDRKRVVFGGRTGFVRLALKHQVPILPMAIHGGHSGFVVLHDGQRVARWLGADRWLRSDTWPVFLGLPWGVGIGPLFHVPLPVRVSARFLPPIPTASYGPDAVDDPEVLAHLRDQVQAEIQAAVEALSEQHRR